MRTWLARSWSQRGPGACLLWPLSLLYRAVSSLHRGLYHTGILEVWHCSVPLIVVGNVVVGGAGKTPLVIALARHFKQQGLQVGVVSRGFGKQSKKCLEVLENTPVSDSGDEPALILDAIKAPVFIADRRIDAVQALLRKYPATQVIISDDGLQHYSLARDIEITVFDDSGVGNGWLIPAGPLRQPYAVGNTTQGLVLHTGQNPAFKGYVSTRRLADYALDAQGHQTALTSLKGQGLTAMAGIAHPGAFFNMLTSCGLQLQQTISLPDHFDFSGFSWPGSANGVVLCTEKDAIKLFDSPKFKGSRLLAVPLEFTPEPDFLTAVDALLAPLLASSSELTSHNGRENGY
jgi:tetraacyldisaccharide 4'-kinase